MGLSLSFNKRKFVIGVDLQYRPFEGLFSVYVACFGVHIDVPNPYEVALERVANEVLMEAQSTGYRCKLEKGTCHEYGDTEYTVRVYSVHNKHRFEIRDKIYAKIYELGEADPMLGRYVSIYPSIYEYEHERGPEYDKDGNKVGKK